MKNSTKIVLILYVISTAVGTILKMNGQKTIGNMLLLVSVATFLYLLYLFIFQFINRKAQKYFTHKKTTMKYLSFFLSKSL